MIRLPTSLCFIAHPHEIKQESQCSNSEKVTAKSARNYACHCREPLLPATVGEHSGLDEDDEQSSPE